jgi:hypothetical protein
MRHTRNMETVHPTSKWTRGSIASQTKRRTEKGAAKMGSVEMEGRWQGTQQPCETCLEARRQSRIDDGSVLARHCTVDVAWPEKGWEKIVVPEDHEYPVCNAKGNTGWSLVDIPEQGSNRVSFRWELQPLDTDSVQCNLPWG